LGKSGRNATKEVVANQPVRSYFGQSHFHFFRSLRQLRVGMQFAIAGWPSQVKDDERERMIDRDIIAKLYGFESFAELLDVSDPLPALPGDTTKSYVAWHPRGHWFVWEDLPPSNCATEKS